MGLFDRVSHLLALEPLQDAPPMQMRSVLAYPFDEPAPSFASQLAALRRAGVGPWRAPTIQQALGVPAIFGAVNLIANTTGSMSMEAMRDEVAVRPQDRPRLIVRPDPLTIPREFYRSTAYNLASRGEAWWFIAKRDGDGNPIALLNRPPAEFSLTENPRNILRPILTWMGQEVDNDDFRQLVWAREPGSLRGWGPLQACGAAVSVSVEAQEWAANFYAGGTSNIWVKTTIPLSGGDEDADGLSEVERFLSQWMDKSPNVPRITDDTIDDIKSIDINPQGSQMLDARAHQNVDVATMFNMDAELLNAAVAGSSLTYQNIGGRFDSFIRMCLQPNVLEVIEETMTDLLTRNIVAKFNTAVLKLDDIKTRYEVYKTGIEAGIIDVEEAREFEGLAPGDVENAPIPFSPPQALPAAIQARSEKRCDARVTRQGILQACNKQLFDGMTFCPRCKSAVA